MTYPTIKMKITPAPKLRGKMDVRFPANVEASTPILLDKSGGTYTFSFDANSLSSTFATAAQGALADTAVQSVVAGSNVTVDNTDPRNPVVSASGGGGGGSGDVTGPSSSVDSEIALFDSTTGKVIKRASTTGILKGTSGVLSAAVAGADYYNPGGTDVAVVDGGTGASSASGARANLGSTTVGDAVFIAADASAARTAIGAGTISTQNSNSVSITGGSITGITDLAIADGGTGQSTASAAFDALAPTTTRGDIVFRNASTNTRLAASTAGYHLQTNGAASDPTYVGFVQTGSGAATRTWNNKASEIVSVKDFGAAGDTKVVTGTTSISSGSAALTVSGAGFTSGDVGKKIYVPGAGSAGATLATTILSYTSSTQVTLNANASTTLSSVSKQVTWGTDDTSAVQAAITSLSSGGRVLFPRGGYLITTQIDIAVSGVALIGEGRGATKIASAASGHTFQIGTGLYYTEVRDMQITRASYPATSGQNGIHFTNLTERALVENVEVTYHYVGIRCGITSFSKVVNALCDNNYSHGMHVTNADAAGGLQWTIINPLVQRNDGYGILYNSPSGNAAVGELINPSTYANKLGGLWFVGTDSSHALNAIRIRGGFAGEDGSHGIYFDTYGTATCRVTGTYTEAAGTAACGVNQSTSATNVGGGLRATANNTAVEFLDCHAIGHSYSGIATNAARTLITGCGARTNGAAAVGGETSGIAINAGNATVTGCSSKANAFGLYLAADGPHVVSGNDFTENTTAAYAAGATLTNSVVFNNIPKTGNELGQRWGTSTNDDARAGKVGEYVSSTIESGSAVSLSNNVQANMTSISLTAGDWDVSCLFQFKGNSATTVSSQEGSLSLTSATLDYTGGKGAAVTGNAAPFNQIESTSAIGLAIPPVRFSLSSTTTIYAVARSIFLTNVQSVYGVLRARRVR